MHRLSSLHVGGWRPPLHFDGCTQRFPIGHSGMCGKGCAFRHASAGVGGGTPLGGVGCERQNTPMAHMSCGCHWSHFARGQWKPKTHSGG